MMKKFLSALLALAMLLGVTSAFAEEGDMAEITGQIVETNEEYMIILDAQLGEVQVWMNEETVFDGVEAGQIGAGQFASVLYDGKMTRSLPPQITALRVGIYPIRGEIVALCGNTALVEQEDGLGRVIVRFAQETPELTAGQSATFYTTGMMTMSLPPQVNAIGVQAAE